MTRRVLILSASAGAGHIRAAEALEKAFLVRGGCAVEHIDAVKFTSRLFRKIYEEAYIELVRRAPAVMGFLYNRLDRPWRHARRRLALDRLNTGPMVRLLQRVQPDLCVATHFLPAEIIAWLKLKRRIRTQLTVVVTDFDVHAMWICKGADRYCVAREEAAEYLARIGVPAETLRVTGIPIDPVFSQPKDRNQMRVRHGLDPNRKTLLVAAGGYGVGPVARLVGDLLAAGRPWQIVAVAGKSEQVRARLDVLAQRAERRGDGPTLHVLGYTQAMDEWMAAADLLVGKAGGLTISEALARGLPMAVIEPIPGQEERNADYVLECGAAVRCNNLPAAAWKIARLLDDTAQLERMRAAAQATARPQAAAAVVSAVLESGENAAA